MVDPENPLYSKKRSMIVEGEVVGEVEKVVTQGGNKLCKFIVTAKGKSLECLAWEANSVKAEKLKDGDKIIARGLLDIEGQSLTINRWIDKGAVKASDLRFELHALYGGKEEYERTTNAKLEDLEKQGIVRICHNERAPGLFSSFWERIEMCIKVNGVWKRKIDYCMDRLGPDSVERTLRAFFSDVDIAPGKASRFNSKKYQEVLDALVKEADGHR